MGSVPGVVHWKSPTPTAWVVNPSKLSGSLSKFSMYAKRRIGLVDWLKMISGVPAVEP